MMHPGVGLYCSQNNWNNSPVSCIYVSTWLLSLQEAHGDGGWWFSVHLFTLGSSGKVIVPTNRALPRFIEDGWQS